MRQRIRIGMAFRAEIKSYADAAENQRTPRDKAM